MEVIFRDEMPTFSNALDHKFIRDVGKKEDTVQWGEMMMLIQNPRSQFFHQFVTIGNVTIGRRNALEYDIM